MINENTKKDDVGFFNCLYNQYYQKIYKYILFITGVRFFGRYSTRNILYSMGKVI